MNNWTPIEQMTAENKPKDGKVVLLSVVGYNEAVLGTCWKNEWFIIDSFGQEYKGVGVVKVTAFMPLPKAYK
jgi:hypothetical protein